MYCSSCGAAVADDARFCAACGATARPEAPPAPPPVVRFRPTAVTLLAILKIVGAVVWIGVAGLCFVAAGAPDGGPVALFIGLPALFLGIACAACAHGLLTLRPHGRILQIALSILGLVLGFPFGAVISIIILIYMFRPGIGLLFSGRPVESMSREEAEHLRLLNQSNAATAVVVAVAVAFLAIPMTGIVAAIAIPNLLNAIDRGKQKRTMADMRTIGAAVDAYAADHDAYPVAASPQELVKLLQPGDIEGLPLLDGWGHPLQLHSAPDGYVLYSFGKDGSGSTCEPAETQTFEEEICLQNGQFVRYPAGVRP